MDKVTQLIENSTFFNIEEFPDGVVQNVDFDLIFNLIKLRELGGCPIVPSPLAGAWYRFDGSPSSRHYAINRKSDAGDVFLIPNSNGDGYRKVLSTIVVAFRIFRGIGIYLDTSLNGTPHLMIHVDNRLTPTYWVRSKGVYYYFNSSDYFILFGRVFEKPEDAMRNGRII